MSAQPVDNAPAQRRGVHSPSSVRSSSAGRHVNSTSHGVEYSVASPSHAPASVRNRPHSQPFRPSEQATGRGGSTREAPRRASDDRISRSRSSSGVGVHTPATVGGPIDRTPKPCLHKQANHQHGTYLAYRFDRCRCTPCETAARRHNKATAYRTVTGTHSYVPAGPARAHVLELLETLTVSQIEQRSGIHRTAIRVLVGDFPGKPASKRIARTTERALLAVTGDRVGVERHGLVDGTGTRRRFRALVALGWPAKQLGDRLGFSSRTNWFMTNPGVAESEPVRASTRDAVRALYDELSLTVPPRGRPATVARNIAAARGWPPPLAWDDDAIDDPDAQPLSADVDDDQVDEHAIELVCDGQPMRLTGRDLEVAVDRLVDRGLTYTEVAARVRSDEKTVRRIRNSNLVRAARAAAREAA